MSLLVLASGSPTRAKMLRDAGIRFHQRPTDLDEDNLKNRHRRLNAVDLARLLAEEKALAASATSEEMVLGADQILEFEGDCLSKMPTLSDLRQQLQRLAGKTHRLISAFAVIQNGSILQTDHDVAVMTMCKLSDHDIDSYLSRVGPNILGCVGGYQIEDIGRQLFDRVDGEYSTVMGLPMPKLLETLQRFGVIH